VHDKNTRWHAPLKKKFFFLLIFAGNLTVRMVKTQDGMLQLVEFYGTNTFSSSPTGTKMALECAKKENQESVA